MIPRRQVQVELWWLIAAAVVVVLVVVLIVYELGGFAAEPPYSSWCDSATHTQIFESTTGAITSQKMDKGAC